MREKKAAIEAARTAEREQLEVKEAHAGHATQKQKVDKHTMQLVKSREQQAWEDSVKAVAKAAEDKAGATLFTCPW